MTMADREVRLLQIFATLLEDHHKDFEGFVRDLEKVRYCHAPMDGQQLGRCEYSLRNMELLLMTLHRCIQVGNYEGAEREALVRTKNDWLAMKARADVCMQDIQAIIEKISSQVHPPRGRN
jgi:hypothetical protein